MQTVKDREFAELAYKYLFSISPVSSEGQIIGLCIFNGLTELENQNDSLTNIYDFELEHPITPRADVVTLTENLTNNSSLHNALLRNSVGLYVTELPQKPIPLPSLNASENRNSQQVLITTDLQKTDEAPQERIPSSSAEELGAAAGKGVTPSTESHDISSANIIPSGEKNISKRKQSSY